MDSWKYTIMSQNDSDNVNDDFKFVRQVQYNILVKGEEALEEMMEVAKATEHPRAFEVLSGMMKNMADVSNNLLDLHKKQKDISKTDEPPALAGPTTNNNVFVGSTADLQKMLMKPVNEIEHE
jgi:hypothetical protein